MKDKEFDGIIKDKLFDFQVDQPYDESTWDDQFASVVQVQERKKSLIWKFLRNSILILLWFSLAWLITSSEHKLDRYRVVDKSDMMQVDRSIKTPKNKPQKDTRAESSKKSNLNTQKILTKPKNGTITQGQVSKPSYNPTNSSRINPVLMPEKVMNEEENNTKKYLNQIDEKNSKLLIPIQKLDSSKSLPQSEQNKVVVEIIDSILASKESNPIDKIDHQGYKPLKEGFIETDLNVQTVEVYTQVKRRKELSFRLGLEYAYLKPRMIEEVERIDKVSLLGEVSWGRFSFLTGISRHNTSYRTIETTPTPTPRLAFLNTADLAFTETNVGYERLEIPLMLRYHQPIYRRWGIVGGIGVSFEKNLKENFSYETEEFLGGGIVRYKVDFETSEDSFHLRKFRGDLNVSYMISPRLSLQSGVAYVGSLDDNENTQRDSNALEYQFRVFYKLWSK